MVVQLVGISVRRSSAIAVIRARRRVSPDGQAETNHEPSDPERGQIVPRGTPRSMVVSKLLELTSYFYQISRGIVTSWAGQRSIWIPGLIDRRMTRTCPAIRPAGFEPATDGLENRCSIHLSYGRNMTGAARALTRRRHWILTPRSSCARQDSNLRPAV